MNLWNLTHYFYGFLRVHIREVHHIEVKLVCTYVHIFVHVCLFVAFSNSINSKSAEATVTKFASWTIVGSNSFQTYSWLSEETMNILMTRKFWNELTSAELHFNLKDQRRKDLLVCFICERIATYFVVIVCNSRVTYITYTFAIIFYQKISENICTTNSSSRFFPVFYSHSRGF